MLTDHFRSANPRVIPGGDTVRVTALLDDAERRLGELKDHPDRQARLSRALGNVRLARGQYEGGMTLLRRAWTWERAQGPEWQADAALTYFELATAAYAEHGSSARPLVDSTITFLRAAGTLDSFTVKALRMRASMEPTQLGAIRYLDEAEALQRRLPGQSPMAMAEALDAEGGRLFSLGRSREAATSFGAALRIVEKLLPRDHPDLLTVRGNYATALGADGDFQAADSLSRDLLRSQQRLYPGSDAEAFAHARLANLLAAQGKHVEAEQEFRATLAILRHAVAPDNDRIWSELRNLGVTVARLGRVEEGYALVDSAYRMAVARQGPGAVGAAFINGQRGYLLLWLGRRAEAERAIQDAARVIEAGTSKAHRYRIDVAYWLALLALDAGNDAEAVSQFSAALERSSDEAADTMPKRAQFACGLGTALARAGRATEARPLLVRACPVFDRHAAEQPILEKWSRDARVRLGIR